MKKRKLGISFMLVAILFLSITGTSQAGIEARPGVSSASKIPNQHFVSIREMEKAGGTLGLNAQIDGTTFLDSSNNGVDVHMAKNTEWGTMAMLSASAYGEAPIGTSNASTTGNETGVFQAADGNWEYVAGMWNINASYNNQIYSAAERYWDKYTETKSKPGDATLETQKWKGAIDAGFASPSGPVFIRNVGALFGYFYSYNSGSLKSRAVLVCGSGL